MHPQQTFAALHAEAQTRAGARLFTVTVQDDAAGVVRRAYSSHPADYPVSGTKPVQDDGFSQQVLVEGRAFVANSLAEFSHLFPDHALIDSLGCQATLNIPVICGGHVLGTVNILDAGGHFTPARIAVLTGLVAERQAEIAAAMRATPMG